MSEETQSRWDGYIGPFIWVPALFILAAALVAMGVIMVVRGDNNDGTAHGSIPGDSLRQRVHWHADFMLVIRGAEFDFDQEQFFSTDDRELTPYSHIHSYRPNVVHVHYEQSTWAEFFNSLGFDLRDTSLTLPDGTRLENSDTETLKFYVNGVRVDTIRASDIGDLDRVLISFGPETHEEVAATQLPMVRDEACIPSERCRDRIDPNEPTEPCSISSESCH